MPEFSLVILYVDSPTASAAFYAGLLGQEPVEASPTFAMFKLPSGTALGLWSRHTVTPAAPRAATGATTGATTGAGGTELAFVVADVDATHAEWTARGLVIAQPPTELDFGRSCVALDPDGHRLRAYTPAAP